MTEMEEYTWDYGRRTPRRQRKDDDFDALEGPEADYGGVHEGEY